MSDDDFLLFAFMLRLELDVTSKTLKRYVVEAWKATHAADVAPTHPKESSLFTLVNGIDHTTKSKPKPKLEYCGIQ